MWNTNVSVCSLLYCRALCVVQITSQFLQGDCRECFFGGWGVGGNDTFYLHLFWEWGAWIFFLSFFFLPWDKVSNPDWPWTSCIAENDLERLALLSHLQSAWHVCAIISSLWGARDWTPSFIYTRQAFSLLSYISTPPDTSLFIFLQ